MLASLFARSTERRFLMRSKTSMTAPTPTSPRDNSRTSRIGLTWDDPVDDNQSTVALRRGDRRAGEQLPAVRVLLHEKGYRPGTPAPHAPQGAYPGICRDLTDAERQTRRRETGRPPALRLRTDEIVYTVTDVLHGRYTGIVDDFVIRRGDGVPAYNLAVVVDDAAQGIDQVVRGDDLLPSTPRQAHLANLLGYPEPIYVHVALVLTPTALGSLNATAP